MTHTHNWQSQPCDLTAAYLYSCECGAELYEAVDEQDGSVTYSEETEANECEICGEPMTDMEASDSYATRHNVTCASCNEEG